MEKGLTRAFFLLKPPTSAFTFRTLLRHYAKCYAKVDMKLGPQRIREEQVREPVKKKNVENFTFGGGGSDPGIFHISKKKVVFKMHFKPF